MAQKQLKYCFPATTYVTEEQSPSILKVRSNNAIALKAMTASVSTSV